MHARQQLCFADGSAFYKTNPTITHLSSMPNTAAAAASVYLNCQSVDAVTLRSTACSIHMNKINSHAANMACNQGRPAEQAGQSMCVQINDNTCVPIINGPQLAGYGPCSQHACSHHSDRRPPISGHHKL
jgi:hypothetical protein